MNQTTARSSGTGLRSFCERFIVRFGKEAFHEPEVLATEFRQYFGINGVPRLFYLKQLALNDLGIYEIGPQRAIGGKRGWFFKYGNNIELQYKVDDWDGSKEFTIAHEIREIMGVVMKDIYPEFVDVEGEELESEAEAFAAAFLMDKDEFYADMVACGFDPIWLHEKYHKSYIAIVSRMATILQPMKGCFWASVYEFDENAPQGFVVARCFHRSPKYIPRVRYRVPNFLFPKRGQLVPLKSNLEIASVQRRPVYVQQLKGLDFWEKYCLSVIIRPVLWGGKVAKLIVVAVPYRDSDKFQKQVLSIRPLVVQESFQVI